MTELQLTAVCTCTTDIVTTDCHATVQCVPFLLKLQVPTVNDIAAVLLHLSSYTSYQIKSLHIFIILHKKLEGSQLCVSLHEHQQPFTDPPQDLSRTPHMTFHGPPPSQGVFHGLQFENLRCRSLL